MKPKLSTIVFLLGLLLCAYLCFTAGRPMHAQSTLHPLKPIQISIWDVNNEAAIVAAFKAEGYTVVQSELDPDHFIDSIVAVPRYLAWDGRRLVSFKAELGPCRCVDTFSIIWKSSFRIVPNLRGAVKEWIKAEGLR